MMAEHSGTFLLVTILVLLTILLIAAMRFIATMRAAQAVARDDRDWQALRQDISDISTRLASVEKILKDV